MDDIELKITLRASAVNVILAALAEEPFRVAAPVIGEIKAQCDAQIATAQKPQTEE